jgi:TonB family protein
MYQFLVTICLFFGCVGAQAQPIKPVKSSTTTTDSTVYEFVDVMPQFGECNEKTAVATSTCSERNMLMYLSRNLKYPDFALEKNIQGRVFVQFVIEKDGSVSEAKVVKDIGGGTGKEGVRVVSQMPNWKPGMQDGKPVRVKYTLPITYKLSDTDDNEPTYTLHFGTYQDERISKSDFMNALKTAPIARNASGEALKVTRLTLTVQHKEKYKSRTCEGAVIDGAVLKLASKVKSGDSALIDAIVNVKGKLITVSRSYIIN